MQMHLSLQRNMRPSSPSLSVHPYPVVFPNYFVICLSVRPLIFCSGSPFGGRHPQSRARPPGGGLPRRRRRAPPRRCRSESGVCRPGGGARGLMMTALSKKCRPCRLGVVVLRMVSSVMRLAREGQAGRITYGILGEEPHPSRRRGHLIRCGSHPEGPSSAIGTPG